MTPRVANFCPVCGTALEQGQRFGKVRPVCPDCGHVVFFEPKVAVVMIAAEDERVLLIKRAVNPGKGWWSLPAGFVDAGEDPKDTVRREMLEETGLEVEIDRLIDVFPRSNDSGTADIIIAYRVRVTGGMLAPLDDAEEARWFAPDELPELGFRVTRILIDRWQGDQL
jgi:ADP-ribose pyrophosphatase YjhB (NUDIX family)